MNFKRTSIITLALAVCTLTFAQKKPAKVRTITLAGIVVDAATMQPMASVDIDDAKGRNFGHTDKSGYFNIAFEYRQIGEIKFDLRIKKAGYKLFTQKEHWGDLPDGICDLFYFGLQKNHSNARPFSVLGKNTMDKKALAYNLVLTGFGKVREQKAFDNDLEKAKKGNDNVLVKVNDKFYVVDDSGWIGVASDKDMVSIDNKKPVPASQLNKIIKRKKIHSMTTVAAADHKVTIYTSNNFKGKK